MVSKIFKLTNENYDVNPNLKTHAVSECPVYGFVVVYICDVNDFWICNEDLN